MSRQSDLVVLVIGGGGREHALAMALVASPIVSAVHVSPGNAGTAMIATNHPEIPSDVESMTQLAVDLSVSLVVVGPEGPLVDGLADLLRSKGIPCFGPDSKNAMLEGSKLVAKNVMKENGVPTADFRIISEQSQIDAALNDFSGNPWVVKRDVLAGGKGVVVTEDREQATNAILEAIEIDGKVLLEAFLPGEEASMLVLMDESGFVCLPASQDHKRLHEGDSGPNTGGMGAYAPAPVVDDEVKSKTIERIVKPMHKYLKSTKMPYRGVLYVGLMIDENNDPYVVEYNVRFGDPECQITLPLIDSDLASHLLAVAEGRLKDEQISFLDCHCLTVVLAAKGYPFSPEKGGIISLPSSSEGTSQNELAAWVNHAGTSLQRGQLIATGGRVLSATGMGRNLKQAAQAAYHLMERIELAESQYRLDIGWRAL
jgi:phosphoribosylamine---glycine ligase